MAATTVVRPAHLHYLGCPILVWGSISRLWGVHLKPPTPRTGIGIHLYTVSSAVARVLRLKCPGHPRKRELLGIPQVILDTHHPWLATNKKWLARYPGVRTAICTKESDLWSKPTTPERALPPDLLATINIENNKAGVKRFGWKNAAECFAELKSCPAALEAVQNLHLQIYVHDTTHDTWKEHTLPPATLPLSSHTFSLACRRGEYVNARNPPWKVGDDPATEFGTSRIALLNATKGLRLQRIRMASSWWSRLTWMELLHALLGAQPGIVGMEMDDGELFPGAQWKDEPEMLARHLALLSRFGKLTDLTLPPASQLGLGRDGGAWCGNAYGGAEGRAYGRMVVRESTEAVERAGELAVGMLPGLRRLAVGESRGNITVGRKGEACVVWPWTGRVVEYAYEAWPEVEGGFGSME
ncbi:hypothetical protein P171DRAFT_525421 [Karstenula rhodostoma CBS 690.94]|uniref:Uncharacterized protein n=1 Tax=Karstenula rhodostoma CBS 690.94 TaxID=1392251 RepID=A0A9P4PAK7_9PLEO|nr:hypothetical protein P171DRAFT_525421 [Karstenula rhodostoma CBS 690.94]